MMTLLAFDTATERMSIALAAGGTVSEHEAIGGEGAGQASAALIPAILSLLARAGVTLAPQWAAGPPQGVAGNRVQVFAERLHTGAARRCPQALPHARALLPLAEDLWAAGGAVDAALALPLYVRDKVAQTTAERDAAR